MTSHVAISYPAGQRTTVDHEDAEPNGYLHPRRLSLSLVNGDIAPSHILSSGQYWTFFTYGFTFLLPWNGTCRYQGSHTKRQLRVP
jgi:hypothetical protein